MDKLTIDKMVEERLSELSNPYKKDPGYDYLKQIAINYKITTVEGFLKSDILEVYKGIFYLENNKDIPIDVICEYVDSFRKILLPYDQTKIDTMSSLCDLLTRYNFFDDGINYLKADGNIKSKIVELKLQNKNIPPRVIYGLKLFKSTYSDILPDVIKCFEIVAKQPKIIDIFSYVLSYTDIFSTYEGIMFAESVAKFINGEDYEVNEKASKKILRDSPSTKRILERLRNITEFIRYEEQEERKAKKRQGEEIYSLKNSLVLLGNAIKNDEITNVREITKGVHNLDLKYTFCQYIYEHNRKYHDKLDEKIAQLENNSCAQYSKILSDYGINIDDFDISIIMHNTLNEVENMLKILRKKMLSDDMIIYILTFSNYNKFSEIMDLVSKCFLSFEYLKSNLKIFAVDSNSLDYFKDNVDYLNENGVNPQLFHDHNYILFNEKGIFKKNIDILKEYDLLKYIKTTNNYDFLLSNDIVCKIDMLIEFGYIDFLKQDLGLLNYNSYCRLKVVKLLDNKIESKDDLVNILDSNVRFFISDSEINKFVAGYDKEINYDSVNDIEMCIDEFRTSSRTFTINDVVFSSCRVERNLKDGNSIGKSIFKGSFHSSDELDSVIEFLKQKNK